MEKKNLIWGFRLIFAGTEGTRRYHMAYRGYMYTYKALLTLQVVVSLNYCSQNGGNLYRAPYYNGNPNIGPRIKGNSDQSPSMDSSLELEKGPSVFGVWSFKNM